MSKTIVQYLNQEAVQENIQNVLKDRANQFVTSVTSLITSNPALQECEKKSLFSACLTAASLDLPINQNLGFAYIVPYNNKVKDKIKDAKTGKEIVKERWEKQAQFQMGWKGFVQLAIRTSKYKLINVVDIKEDEIKRIDMLSGEIEFSDEFSNANHAYLESRKSKKTIGYVSYFRLHTGFSKFLFMSLEELQAHGKKYSKSYKYGLWNDDPEYMYKKTVIKQLLSKYGIMTSEMQQAITHDQGILSDGQIQYADNATDSTSDIAKNKERNKIIKHIENSKTYDELKEVKTAVNDFNDPDLLDMYDIRESELTAG